MSAADSFGFKMVRYADNITDVNRKATIAAALVYKSGVLTSAASFLGSDLRFSVWKKAPAYGPSPRFGAGFEVGGSKVHANALFKLRKKQGKKVMSRGGQIFGTTATVRGMRGQQSWSKGIRSSGPGAIQAYKRTQKLALLEASRR
jgi:hypothetical protein